MKLYTSRAIATVLDMTDRNVRELRAKNIIHEAKPGLYELIPTVNAYVNHIRGKDADADTYTEQRARLTKAKADAAELETRLRKGELHETEEVERAVSTLVTNLRTRALSLPAKLAPKLMQLNGDEAAAYELLLSSVEEMLDEMSHFDAAFETPEANDDEGTDSDPGGRSAAAGTDREADGGDPPSPPIGTRTAR